MIRRPPRSTPKPSSAASDVYKRQIDTRALTKRIRTKGSMLGRLLALQPHAPMDENNWRQRMIDVPWHDPNGENLVARVSRKTPMLFTPQDTQPAGLREANEPTLMHASGRPIRIMALDLGMKRNQIRCFTSRGVELKVCLLYTSPSPRDGLLSRMPSSA